MKKFVSRESLAGALRVDGVSWGDFDNDGDDDLFVAAQPGSGRGSALLRNDAGVLTDVTDRIGLPAMYASSAYFADYDADGFLDLFVASIEDSPENTERSVRLRILKNYGGTRFAHAPKGVGLDESRVSRDGSFAIGDLNDDGWLDIVGVFSGTINSFDNLDLTSLHFGVRDYLYGRNWQRILCGEEAIRDFLDAEPEVRSRTERLTFGLEQFLERHGCLYIGKEIAPGMVSPLFDYATARYYVRFISPGDIHLWENTGGSFRAHGSLLADHALLPPPGITNTGAGTDGWKYSSYFFFQPATVDLDHDGRLDLLVGTDSGAALAFRNDGNLNFTLTEQLGLNIHSAVMGIGFGDPLRKGETSMALSNAGSSYVLNRTAVGYEPQKDMSVNTFGFGWGIVYFDADNDGYPELYTSNGWFGGATSSPFYQGVERPVLYQNRGGSLRDISGSISPPIMFASRPAAVADANMDGRPDIAIGGSRPDDEHGAFLLLNQSDSGSFVKVRLRGPHPNLFGIGASITVYTNESKQTQELRIGESFFSQHSLTKMFGLGDAATDLVRISVRWHDGRVQESTARPGEMVTITYDTL